LFSDPQPPVAIANMNGAAVTARKAALDAKG
jgi:hypothetical protein